jgi:hypothetical protein
MPGSTRAEPCRTTLLRAPDRRASTPVRPRTTMPGNANPSGHQGGLAAHPAGTSTGVRREPCGPHRRPADRPARRSGLAALPRRRPWTRPGGTSGASSPPPASGGASVTRTGSSLRLSWLRHKRKTRNPYVIPLFFGAIPRKSGDVHRSSPTGGSGLRPTAQTGSSGGRPVGPSGRHGHHLVGPDPGVRGPCHHQVHTLLIWPSELPMPTSASTAINLPRATTTWTSSGEAGRIHPPGTPLRASETGW